MSQDIIVWLIDDHEMRRLAVSSFLADWTARKTIDLRLVNTLQEITPANDTRRELCIRNTGGTSLHDSGMAVMIHDLMARLAGRPMVILTDIDTVEETRRALEIGANALLSTALNSAVAVAALDFVLAGGTYFPRPALAELAARNSKANDACTVLANSKMIWLLPETPDGPHRLAHPPGHIPIPDVDVLGSGEGCALTPRQTEIVAHLKKGRSNKEIARILDISDATVNIFVRQVIKKFGVSNRTQVALRAADALNRDIGYLPQRAVL